MFTARKIVVGLVLATTIASGAGVANADQTTQDRIDCWVPQPQQPQAPTISRQRADGVWEALMASGRAELLTGPNPLCVEVLPGMYVWHTEVQAVVEFLHGLNGEVLFFGQWVKWSPMLYAMGKIAQCESSGNWHARNGRYGGLFQIAGLDPNTEPQVQVDAFYSVFDRQGFGAWECAKRFGLQ